MGPRRASTPRGAAGGHGRVSLDGGKRSDDLRLAVTVVGTPGPQGSKRHVGGGRMIESSALVAPWRVAVAWYTADAMRAAGWVTLDGPVALDVVFRLRRPPSAPRARVWPCVKPDLDKLVRSTCDALVECGAVADDARVVDLRALKTYASDGRPAGALIQISPVRGVL